MQKFLLANLLPDKAGVVIAKYVTQFATKAERLTWIGVVTLAATALLQMQTIEKTFNMIWRIRSPRPLLKRIVLHITALLLGPVGVPELVHRDADLAVARAAAAEGVGYVFSNQASVPLERCAAAMGSAPRWFQLYWSSDDDFVRSIVGRAEKAGCEILLPSDVVTAREFKAGADAETKPAADVADGDLILDAGPDAVARLAAAMDASKTLIWNGPLGVFEMEPFDAATVSAARHAAELTRAGKLVAVAGGGDTVAAMNHAGVAGALSFVSTAGGAFLEWMEGKPLPGVDALKV